MAYSRKSRSKGKKRGSSRRSTTGGRTKTLRARGGSPGRKFQGGGKF